MKAKICGMKYRENLLEAAALQPDYLGFIFYPGSPRYMKDSLTPADLSELPSNIGKTGVFVNSTAEEILREVSAYGLDAVQLHGEESVGMVAELRQRLEPGVIVIKSFGVDAGFDWASLNDYQDSCDFFLFDTKSPNYGGSGMLFDHELLRKYSLRKPFFLGGGIGLENLDVILQKPLPMLAVLDMNSRLEVEPGRKDIRKVAAALELIRTQERGN